MVEGSGYGDSLSVVLTGDISVTITLRGGVLTGFLTGKTSGSENNTITSTIDTPLARFSRWRYLIDRVFARLTFAIYNVFCPFSTEYIQYSPDQGFSRLSKEEYEARKTNMYNLATKPIQPVRKDVGRNKKDNIT